MYNKGYRPFENTLSSSHRRVAEEERRTRQSDCDRRVTAPWSIDQGETTDSDLRDQPDLSKLISLHDVTDGSCQHNIKPTKYEKILL